MDMVSIRKMRQLLSRGKTILTQIRDKLKYAIFFALIHLVFQTVIAHYQFFQMKKSLVYGR